MSAGVFCLFLFTCYVFTTCLESCCGKFGGPYFPEIPSLFAAVKTLISDKVTESSGYEGESEYEASVALQSPPP